MMESVEEEEETCQGDLQEATRYARDAKLFYLFLFQGREMK